jgi:hypothetical protein
MTNIESSRTILRAAASRFRDCSTTLALTDIVWKILAFVALTPLVALLFRARLAMSGRTVAADQDILLIFLEPAGLASAILLGAMLLAIVALEQGRRRRGGAGGHAAPPVYRVVLRAPAAALRGRLGVKPEIGDV